MGTSIGLGLPSALTFLVVLASAQDAVDVWLAAHGDSHGLINDGQEALELLQVQRKLATAKDSALGASGMNLTEPCPIGGDVWCPFEGGRCMGDSCCQGRDGGTFPCPSARPDWTGCTSNAKVWDCTAHAAEETTPQPPPPVQAPETPPQEHEQPIQGGGGGGSTLVVKNACADKPMWIASTMPPEFRHLVQNNLKLEAGASHSFRFPADKTVPSTRFWPKLECEELGTRCKVGSSGGPGQDCGERGCAPPVDSKFEATWTDLNTAQPVDWFDTSGVDGYTVPFTLTTDSTCPLTALNCTGLTLDRCPRSEQLNSETHDLRVFDAGGEVVGCYSHCGKLTYSNWKDPSTLLKPADEEARKYCCPTPPVSSEECREGPVKDTQYVGLFRDHCKNVYSYAYDDAAGLHTCPVGTTYYWTLFCPS